MSKSNAFSKATMIMSISSLIIGVIPWILSAISGAGLTPVFTFGVLFLMMLFVSVTGMIIDSRGSGKIPKELENKIRIFLFLTIILPNLLLCCIFSGLFNGNVNYVLLVPFLIGVCLEISIFIIRIKYMNKMDKKMMD